MRKLIEAAVYRKFVFDSKEEVYDYLKGGYKERWLIDFVEEGDKVEAVIGETYNGTDSLMLEVDSGNKGTDQGV